MTIRLNKRENITRLQFEISEDRLRELEALINATGASTKKELMNNALTLFEWAVNEEKAGNTIASINENSKSYRELVMPLLKNVKKRVV